jgi:hypothetical protein
MQTIFEVIIGLGLGNQIAMNFLKKRIDNAIILLLVLLAYLGYIIITKC